MCVQRERACSTITIGLGIIFLLTFTASLIILAMTVEKFEDFYEPHWARQMDAQIYLAWESASNYYFDNPVVSNIILASLPVITTFLCVFYNLMWRGSKDSITINHQVWGGRRYEYTKFLHSRLEQ
jgi:hypothetical protein